MFLIKEIFNICWTNLDDTYHGLSQNREVTSQRNQRMGENSCIYTLICKELF